MLTRLKKIALLLPLGGMLGLASAAQPLLLQDSQVLALGIETIQLGAAREQVTQRLPARVSVPLKQLRLVAAPAEGMIEMLAVSPGDTVKQGQVIAHLRSTKVLELQAAEMAASSQSSLEQENLQRDELLFAEGLIPESRLKATRNTARQARTMASERRLGLSMAGITPGKMGSVLALTAPIDGTVLEQTAQLGQRVEAAAAIYRIGKLSPLWLDIQAPLDMAANLQVGDKVNIVEPALAGRLIAIGRSVDPGSQSVLLRAQVTEGADRLTPGQVIEVDLAGGQSAGQRAGQGAGSKLPAAALVRVGKDNVVFVQTTGSDKKQHFTPRPVQVLAQGGQNIAVNGLQAGEMVVVKGASSLKGLLQSQVAE